MPHHEDTIYAMKRATLTDIAVDCAESIVEQVLGGDLHAATYALHEVFEIEIRDDEQAAWNKAFHEHLALRLGEYRAADFVRRAREALRHPAPAQA